MHMPPKDPALDATVGGMFDFVFLRRLEKRI